MNVLIDADGCPVVDIAVQICRRYPINCTIICDTAHEFNFRDVDTITVAKGADSADYTIVKMAKPHDIVITQDYGLASMCLALNANVLHQDGWEYTSDNIDVLLMMRHEHRRLRESGKHVKGPSKRTSRQNENFCSSLERMIQNKIHG